MNLSKPCNSNSDCLHGGNCTKNGTCSCPEGTNGTLCENAVECIKHPDMCGKGTDVNCVFDDKSKSTMCRCVDKKKFYNHFSERCAVPCRNREKNGTLRSDCGIYGRCVNSFCVCVKGISGDRCEIIDQCKEVDCGKDPSATCTLGIDGAYCMCKEAYQVFDEKEKVCTGKPCSKSTDCMYGGNCTSDGTCSCPVGTYGTFCQDVHECIKNPEMCGNGTDVKCIFDVYDEEASCSCDDKKKWFNSFKKRCAEPCEKYVNHKLVKEDCGKYGRCTSSFCFCVKGISGDRCEVIDQCFSGEVDCKGDPSATCSLGIDGAYCKCDKVFQVFDKTEKRCKGEPCKNDSDCMYGGNCSEDGTCFCPKGVGGPLCQQVYECEKRPEKCGNGTDVKCLFDVDEGIAECRCDDGKKDFDDIEKKCKNICKSDEDCGIYGTCDKYSFCRCLERVSGDYCEVIEKCRNMDCGTGTNCTLGSDGEAHCKCQDLDLGFDYKSKICKACECGDHSEGCEFRNGEKQCECSINYFHSGDKCEACNCGDLSKGCELRDGKKECFCPLNYTTIGDKCQKCSCGIGSYHCKMEEGKTKCLCYETYNQRKNKCEFCDCGVHGGNCSFADTGEKQCHCKPGFKMLKETGFCAEVVCNDTNTCQNGGVCQEGLCKCHEDYAGAWCETPKWCMHSRCMNDRDKVECIWDRAKREGRCECKEPYHIYREEDRSCEKCDCGRDGRCMMTERGEKVCICDKGYADYLLQCKRCDCGYYSTNCSFDWLGKKLCQCVEGRKQQNSKTYWDDDLASCVSCDCGENGTCRFDEEKKVCDCDENYKVHNGICRECNCGPYGFCSFDSDGNKVCTCDFGYSVLDGRCESCDCEPSDMRGIGTVCLFEKTVKECHCPRGYQSPKNDFCKDINECLNKDACPANTECFNQPGSYSCQCKKGFKITNTGLDPKKFGCEDINECAEHPCTDPNTACVNTPGSYDCKCKDGYYATSSTSGLYYNPKNSVA
ncbi:unnamed protein product [Larinioides sclopetarius]|uniref:EGF-like domain-containing protein n=1 Tax=Larinioides sclopetarius TaxID=280406 RepID=A0AAV2BLU5_9ARAC